MRLKTILKYFFLFITPCIGYSQHSRCFEDLDSNFQTKILLKGKNIFIEGKTSYATFKFFGKIKNGKVKSLIDSTGQLCSSIAYKKIDSIKDEFILDLELIRQDSTSRHPLFININSGQKHEKALIYRGLSIINGELHCETDFEKIQKNDKTIYRYRIKKEAFTLKNILGKSTSSKANYYSAKIFVANDELSEGYSMWQNRFFKRKHKQVFLLGKKGSYTFVLNKCSCSNYFSNFVNEVNSIVR